MLEHGLRARSTAKVESPGSVMLSITFTMSLDDWRRLCEQIAVNRAFPTWLVRDHIGARVAALEKVVAGDVGDPPAEQEI